MTVYEWIMSKDKLNVTFDKTIDGDYIESLEIKMDAGFTYCEYSAIINNDNTLTFFPITIERTYDGNQIPDNDAEMLQILDQMYQDLATIFNNIKNQNK